MKLITDYLNSGSIKQQNQKRLGVLLICATAILLCIALVILMVASIATAINNQTPDDDKDGDDTGSGIPSGYTTTTVDATTQLAMGNLLLLDAEHPYVGGTPATVKFYGHETRPRTDEGSVTYTINGTDVLGATEETVKALNEMLADYYDQSKTNDNPAGDDCLWITGACGSGPNNPFLQSGYGVALGYKTGEMKNYASIYNVDQYEWIYEHAADYGFIRASDVEGEENVFRYIGKAHTALMSRGSKTVAEYLEFLKANYNSPSANTVRVGSEIYRVYYQAANAETPIYVPEKNSYTISGNNVDGYIITENRTINK